MKVSVVTACRNSNMELLSKMINSVLNQTFSDFEFIIIDDGSDTPLEDMVKKITNDNRVKIYRIKPSGLGAALNYGIERSNAKYIARIDDDDIMVNSRIEKQKTYLDLNEHVVCVGTQIFFKHDNKFKRHKKFPLGNKEIVSDLIQLKFSIAHTSVMFRKSEFDKIGGYRIKGGGQDLDLFLQLSTCGELNNLEEYLTYYTLSLNGLSVSNPQKYDAYLFALNQIYGNAIFLEYKKLIEKSIEIVTKLKSSKKMKINLKRILLIIYTKLFGYTLRPIKNE